ncbi:uncharacterized protein Dwil_GK28229 [Drosophila willistoni]|uniref:BPTI/Kunitz inhibitor domain-containing protein n=1 Tax=Drosophila willistoni TaxID=7260 RepID=A0A0Q9WR59_DROWI|nr:male accessory gland serine protease inhibitor-like [Drosophila willistoni]XP_046866558.1 male accessory gland serine protease inhibitor-like [Drosophila willistoni]XP_046866559.1 male accessory gland serine protease inhibitor-like [Drosophila willistoni]KRF98457.1 uncharacterized protein Dwil_GK28229 [Drosophila willistoni]
MKFLIIFCSVCALFGLNYAAKNPICNQPPGQKGGPDLMCLALVPSWTYYASSNDCRPFFYGGCGGNDNRFNFKEQCEEKCKD